MKCLQQKNFKNILKTLRSQNISIIVKQVFYNKIFTNCKKDKIQFVKKEKQNV
jgi:hypothetical protein